MGRARERIKQQFYLYGRWPFKVEIFSFTYGLSLTRDNYQNIL